MPGAAVERHFLGNELCGTRLDLLALCGSKFANDVVYVSGHDLFPFRLLESVEMRVKTLIRLRDELPVS
jgi:hypothetical protein